MPSVSLFACVNADISDDDLNEGVFYNILYGNERYDRLSHRGIMERFRS